MCDIDWCIKAEEFNSDTITKYVNLGSHDYIDPESMLTIMKGVSKGKFGCFTWETQNFDDDEWDFTIIIHYFFLKEFDTEQERDIYFNKHN